MTFGQIIVSQFQDPFRIVLLGGLVYTMLRTRHQTGVLLPLALGVVFVAVIIPSTLGAAQSQEPLLRQILAGLVSNSVITGVILGLLEIFRRLRGG
ncbi:hypothetical protein [Pseudogemmobacter sonorensis]|uniref:hypothetical protein n=1 Tax=Pseudogemmobacter sonorensis TaxID=2989681 RepID=UPI0036760F56